MFDLTGVKAIRVRNKNQFDNLMYELEKAYYRFANGEKPTSINAWSIYDSDTVIILTEDNRIKPVSIESYKNYVDSDVTEFEELQYNRAQTIKPGDIVSANRDIRVSDDVFIHEDELFRVSQVMRYERPPLPNHPLYYDRAPFMELPQRTEILRVPFIFVNHDEHNGFALSETDVILLRKKDDIRNRDIVRILKDYRTESGVLKEGEVVEVRHVALNERRMCEVSFYSDELKGQVSEEIPKDMVELVKLKTGGMIRDDKTKQGEEAMTTDGRYEKMEEIPNIGSANGTLVIWRDKDTKQIFLERGCSGKLSLDDFVQRVLKTHAPDGELNKHGRRYLDIVTGLKAMYPDWKGKEIGYINCMTLFGDNGSYVHLNKENHDYLLSDEIPMNVSKHAVQTLFTWDEAKRHAANIKLAISKRSEDEKTALIWTPQK